MYPGYIMSWIQDLPVECIQDILGAGYKGHLWNISRIYKELDTRVTCGIYPGYIRSWIQGLPVECIQDILGAGCKGYL